MYLSLGLSLYCCLLSIKVNGQTVHTPRNNGFCFVNGLLMAAGCDTSMSNSRQRVALRKQAGEKVVIGVNRFFEEEEEVDIETHDYDHQVVERQLARLQRVRQQRDDAKLKRLLGKLQARARDEGANLMPVTIDLVGAGATMGEIVEALREVWGSYRETPVF